MPYRVAAYTHGADGKSWKLLSDQSMLNSNSGTDRIRKDLRDGKIRLRPAENQVLEVGTSRFYFEAPDPAAAAEDCDKPSSTSGP